MPSHYEHSDQTVESLLKDESLSDDEKYRAITQQYIERLQRGGSPEGVRNQDRIIRDEIKYHKQKIETSFEQISYSKDESVYNMIMTPIRIKEKAIATALAEVVINVEEATLIPPEDQHIFNEAKRLDWEVEKVKDFHESNKQSAGIFYGRGQFRLVLAIIWGAIPYVNLLCLLFGIYVLYDRNKILKTWKQRFGYTQDYAREANLLVRKASTMYLGAGLIALLLPLLVMGYLYRYSLFIEAPQVTQAKVDIVKANEVFQVFLDNRKGTIDQKKKAINAGEQYIDSFSNLADYEPSGYLEKSRQIKEYIKNLRMQIAKYEEKVEGTTYLFQTILRERKNKSNSPVSILRRIDVYIKEAKGVPNYRKNAELLKRMSAQIKKEVLEEHRRKEKEMKDWKEAKGEEYIPRSSPLDYYEPKP